VQAVIKITLEVQFSLFICHAASLKYNITTILNNKISNTLIFSGVARVLCAMRQETFLRSLSTNTGAATMPFVFMYSI